MKTVKQLSAIISALKTGTTKRRAQIQEALELCGYYAAKDRNMDPMLRLFEAVGNETNVKAMSHWVTSHPGIPVYFRDGKPQLSDAKQKELANTGWTDAEYATASAELGPWFELAKKDNTASNVWDSYKYASDVADLLERRAKAAAKEDSELAKLLRDAELMIRAKLTAMADA